MINLLFSAACAHRSYYSVLLGWCGYYFVFTCANPLPQDQNISNSTFYQLQVSMTQVGVTWLKWESHDSSGSHVYTGQQLACAVPWGGHAVCHALSQPRGIHHRAREQGGGPHPSLHHCLLFLLGSLPSLFCRWHHSYVFTVLEWVYHMTVMWLAHGCHVTGP